MSNLSDPKVRVTKVFGGGGALGMCDPQVGLPTQYGRITVVNSGNATVLVGVGNPSSPVNKRFYTDKLFVTEANAISDVAWPTGVGCVLFGHDHGMLANGSPSVVGSGTTYYAGDDQVHTYGRLGDQYA